MYCFYLRRVINIYHRYKTDYRANTKLALPIIAGQLGQVAVQFADSIMVGKLGAAPLAAVSFAIALFAVFFVVGMGVSFALPPLVSEADGAGEEANISRYFKHSLVANVGIAAISIIVILAGMPLLEHMGQDPEVAAYAKEYLYFAAWSMLPYMVFQALRCFAEGKSETLLPMYVIVAGNVINIALNYVLIFGKLGMPAMGVEGASLASLIARVAMVVLIVVLLYRRADLWHYLAACNYRRYQSLIFGKIAALGVPTSLQMLFEVSAFSGAAIIMGTLSKDALAAHQIAINLASMSFMVCTGLAMAATIRVGNQLGRRDWAKLRDAGLSAMIQVTVFMAMFAVFFGLLRYQLPFLYIDDYNVVKIAASLLLMAAIFQIPDGMQVVALSALRGLQDVRVPTIVTFGCYWLVGIPVSYLSSQVWDWGPAGVWAGLIIGLTLSSVLMTIRFVRLSRRMG